jgi:multidrug efflux pump subunit AcrA (membrane-fusion protein)
MGLLKNKLVKAGEVIAILESRDLVAQCNEAVAALNQERASERSVTTGTIPQTNAQDQKALRDAQAKLATARATYQRRSVLYEKGGIVAIAGCLFPADQLPALNLARESIGRKPFNHCVCIKECPVNSLGRCLE